MRFIFKHFDNPIFSFSLTTEFDGTYCQIDETSYEKDNLWRLPLDLGTETNLPSNEKLLSWLRHRTIPQNRQYVHNFLAKLGLNERDTLGIISVCYGLSLNDSYWICPDYEKRTFEKVNLYTNNLSRILSVIAFTGYGSYTRSTFRSSPEFTTNGMLAKAWRRQNGTIFLYKSGTEGAANTGKEPYSEFYASQIAEKMGIKSIPYQLKMWQKRLCSTCELFTSAKTAYMPAGNLISHGGIRAVLEYYRNLGDSFYNDLLDMFVFDAVILNTDRHLGNFGFLINSETNTIIDTAPVFDNGLSLCCYAMSDDFENLDDYVKSQQPALYPDFIQFARELMGESQREKLRHLIGFTFKKDSRYNLDSKRLKQLEQLIQKRVKELLG